MTQKQLTKRREQLAKATGIDCPAAQGWLIDQLINALYFPEGTDNATKANALEAALSLLVDIAPQNGIEAMLAVQMIAIQAATMDCLRRAQAPLQTHEARAGNIRMAASLSARFAAHGVVLRRLRHYVMVERAVRGKMENRAGPLPETHASMNSA